MLANCVKQISRYSDEVDCFLDGSELLYDTIINGTKIISDFSKACAATTGVGGKRREKKSRPAFQELHVKGFDCEQIWQGVELNNEQQIDLLGTKVNDLLNNSDGQLFLVKKDVEDEHSVSRDDTQAIQSSESDFENISNREIESDRGSNEEEIEENYPEGEDSEEGTTKEKLSSKKTGKKSKVDDDFFVLEDMNKFLDAEDRKEMRTSAKDGDDDLDDGIDYFADELSDDNDEDDDDSDDEFDKVLNSASEAVGR